jgi:hypothetical protein
MGIDDSVIPYMFYASEIDISKQNEKNYKNHFHPEIKRKTYWTMKCTKYYEGVINNEF